MRSKLSDNTDRVLKLWDSGTVSARQIAERYGVKPSSVMDFLRRHGRKLDGSRRGFGECSAEHSLTEEALHE